MGEQRWQSIDTAPKDGSPIWAWLNQSGIRLVRWWTAEEAAEEEGGNPDDYQEGFYEVDDEDVEWSPRWWLPEGAIPVPPSRSAFACASTPSRAEGA